MSQKCADAVNSLLSAIRRADTHGLVEICEPEDMGNSLRLVVHHSETEPCIKISKNREMEARVFAGQSLPFGCPEEAFLIACDIVARKLCLPAA